LPQQHSNVARQGSRNVEASPQENIAGTLHVYVAATKLPR